MPHPRQAPSRTLRWLPLLLPVALWIVTGVRGIDFGFHWDEPYHVARVQISLDRGAPLPGEYRYPGVSYWMTLLGAVPEITRALRAGTVEDRKRARDAVGGKGWLLRTRTLFLLVTGLTVPCVYALVLLWRESTLEALVASLLVASSWEVAYHARWIAPDGVVMLFAASTSLLAMLALLRPGRPGLLLAGAVSGGLAFATKWPAGLLLVPVWIAAWRNAEGATPGQRVRRVLVLGGAAAAIYLVVTPGTIFEPRAMLESLEMQQSVYGGGHLGHRAAPGPGHVIEVLDWLGRSVFSPWAPASLAFLALAALGAVSLWREDRVQAAAFLSFPVLYLGFFAAYAAVIVRNYLALVPFAAVLAARGLTWILELVRPKWARALVAAAVGAVFLGNAAWLWQTSTSIRDHDRTRELTELAEHLAAHPDVRYGASPRVLEELRSAGLAPGSHVRRRPLDAADEVVVHTADTYRRIVGLRPGHGLTTGWFGPYEVNFDYYPSWLGRDRIIVLRAERFPRRSFLPENVPADLRPGRLTVQDP